MEWEKGFFLVSAQYMSIQSRLPEKISYLVCQIIPLCDKNNLKLLIRPLLVGGWDEYLLWATLSIPEIPDHMTDEDFL